MKKYVDVIVPLPIASQYTYSLPAEMEEKVQIGCRVVVPFGRKKFYTAIVTNVHYAAPEGYETKDIEEVLDSTPVLLPKQFEFWEWLASYYLCTLGDVYKAAIPSGMKLESETLVVYNPDFEASASLPEKEQKILDLLSNDTEQCVTQLEKASGMKNILPVIKSLLDKEAIYVKEELKRNYKPRTEARVKLADSGMDEARLQQLFNDLGRAPKQLALLMKYIELSGWVSRETTLKEVTKKTLLEKAGGSAAILNGLVEKGVFEIYYQEIGRLDKGMLKTTDINPLNPAQQQAYQSVLQCFREKTDDPHKNPDAHLIETVPVIDAHILSLAGDKGSALATGGMVTKLHAAQIATAAGCEMVIANGEKPEVLYDIVDGRRAGTRFLIPHS